MGKTKCIYCGAHVEGTYKGTCPKCPKDAIKLYFSKNEPNMENKYIKKAAEWFDSAVSKDMFSSTRQVAILSIAEYLANLDGKTNYPVTTE